MNRVTPVIAGELPAMTGGDGPMEAIFARHRRAPSSPVQKETA